MQPESLVREPVSGRRLLAARCLGGLPLATIYVFASVAAASRRCVAPVGRLPNCEYSVQEGPVTSAIHLSSSCPPFSPSRSQRSSSGVAGTDR